MIVGAGHAGGAVAAQLRQFGFAGPITLVGEEAYPPYQRPPLSKAWLKGEAGSETLLLRPADYYAGAGIELRLGATATALDREGRAVQLSDGSVYPYDSLILACGARPRTLPVPGAGLDGVLALRSIADADRLKAVLRPGLRLAIIGGGYIGLEVAASARHLGAEATVIERESRLLARVACPELSAFYADTHTARGVRFVLGAGVEALTGTAGQVCGVALSDGNVIACDAVLVGVGAQPNDELAQAAGLACDSGVVVDLEARTSDPAIFAIGDMTRRPLPLYGCTWRLESVPNALEQGKQAAAAITGRPAPAPEVPWFWSDQYEFKLQIAGLPIAADQVLIRGNAGSGRFAAFHLRSGAVVAVEAVNAPQEFMAGKLLIASQKPVDVAQLVDTGVPMKEVVASSAAVCA
ncbi:ferredoxin reductase [Chelatococcus reniformis]|uniref:Ferredoxin reductase n=1 Tax=Chelatococcus reniformis TaxID=1494448 RepID=A0A916UK11_9HYPH|nr:ferredoxin reductase [Chelatococcus reniformis]